MNNTTTLTIKLKHNNSGEEFHPVHVLLQNAIADYNQKNKTNFCIMANILSNFDDNVVSISGDNTKQRLVIFNPVKHVGEDHND